ncbi:Fe(3+) dicitrate transport protein FecA [Candidatus Phycosocius bacilliformis]|uniref:Fe(3+) dicitrate transport protein FecA n=1 Tax=Candidatus Phycosocius bacilliformis TaxID=1445552 RepID=A0A2P2ECG0_9PROT|nr:TonB-dependent receptor [Candidatus Phycosocius bacilliformis]GBF58758.1 Fe(3+) dicitrate transport protein FecA [Candidatus Phycosocius bacilliformis]
MIITSKNNRLRPALLANLACLGVLVPCYAAAASASAEASQVETVIVIGQRDGLRTIAGSGSTIEQTDLVKARVLNVNEALRQAPGVFARDEEGMGLRPNIGIRGLSPTRSSKVLLLEDGLPLSYAPYGDNATYYHPPIRRYDRIEVLKGASQIRFGPNTVGGVINYVTPRAPDVLTGQITLSGGDRGYGEADLNLGGPIGDVRALLHANATQSDGVRDNQALKVQDIYLKLEKSFGANHDVALRLSRYHEDSQVTYSGLTQAEYLANPRQNPFVNDGFKAVRVGASVLWAWSLDETTTLKTSASFSWFDRDWWRQSSNSAQRPNDASDPSCGTMANLLTSCGNEGRLREYQTYGLESRLSRVDELGPASLESEFGLRYNDERQNRLQINSDTPTGRTPGTSINAGVRENNLRYVEAWSGFATTKATIGAWTISPGLRYEHIDLKRINRLNAASPIAGEDRVVAWIPGLGISYRIQPRLTAYVGVHEGFSPPRVEDAINNSTGSSVNLEAETSTNWEAGLRGDIVKGLGFDVTWFRMAFDNQIVPSSVAGGIGATLTSAGSTLHQGLEASVRGSLVDMGVMAGDDLTFRAAVTYVGDARYDSRRFSAVPGSSAVQVTGNRLPYAPEWLINMAVGYQWGTDADVQIEYGHTGKMFTDDLNTVVPTADGQRGRIKAADNWNVTLNLHPDTWPVGVYIAVKNATDARTITDRSRGILPGPPRQVQFGLTKAF